MAQSRDSDWNGSRDDTDTMSIQPGKRMIDHMVGGSASYESKR